MKVKRRNSVNRMEQRVERVFSVSHWGAEQRLRARVHCLTLIMCLLVCLNV